MNEVGRRKQILRMMLKPKEVPTKHIKLGLHCQAYHYLEPFPLVLCFSTEDHIQTLQLEIRGGEPLRS